MINRNMRLFGMPYQFSELADPRYKGLSEKIGRSYVDKILTQAPAIYIVPGEPVFLPGVEDTDEVRMGIMSQLLNVQKGNLGNLFTGTTNSELRYYDFQEAYGEYMQYVNMMCRTTATFMGLGQRIPMGTGTSLQQYNWKNYGWDREKYGGAWRNEISYLWDTTFDLATGFFSKIGSAWSGNAITDDVSLGGSGIRGGGGQEVYNQNFIQFYVDPSSGSGTTFGNNTRPSSIKGMLDTASSSMKEWGFVTQTAGLDTSGLEQIGESAVGALSDIADSAGALGKTLNRILNVGKQVIKGDSIILPDIYQDSDFGQDYNINISLRSPYGNRFAVYMDVIVPLLHLIALVAPRQSSANSYGSPFLVKVYYPGVFNVNLGIVESLQISRPSNEDSWSVDGLPTEIDVTMRIKDLYSDFSMVPSTDPRGFANNSSLIDYLSTIAGVNLTQPQLETKVNQWINRNISAITDIPQNFGSIVGDYVGKKFLNIVSL